MINYLYHGVISNSKEPILREGTIYETKNNWDFYLHAAAMLYPPRRRNHHHPGTRTKQNRLDHHSRHHLCSAGNKRWCITCVPMHFCSLRRPRPWSAGHRFSLRRPADGHTQHLQRDPDATGHHRLVLGRLGILNTNTTTPFLFFPFLYIIPTIFFVSSAFYERTSHQVILLKPNKYERSLGFFIYYSCTNHMTFKKRGS